jgi:hypothetical protein
MASEERSPICRGFEYRVRLAVSIPLAWAELLRDVALHHYDALCRESAKAGVVNGLRNTACDSEHPSSFPVEWRDLDLLAKIMEQARYHTALEQELEGEINAWIRQAKGRLVERSAALAKWDSEQSASILPAKEGAP